MTVEQLLKPRYKVIADYPFSPYKVGDLMKQNGSTSFFITTHKEYVYGKPIDVEDSVFESTLAKYPHLFRKLHWWEERALEEMPEYVKVVSDDSSLFIGDVHKVKKWYFYDIGEAGCTLIESKTGPYSYSASHLQPATETEYNEYLNRAMRP